MNRNELIERLRDRLPLLNGRERALLVNEMLAAITSALEAGRRVEIRGFGVFELRHRAERHALNPRTGRPVYVAAKRVPFFRAGKHLLIRVRGSDQGLVGRRWSGD